MPGQLDHAHELLQECTAWPLRISLGSWGMCTKHSELLTFTTLPQLVTTPAKTWPHSMLKLMIGNYRHWCLTHFHYGQNYIVICMYIRTNTWTYITIHFTSPTQKILEQGMKIFFERKPLEKNSETWFLLLLRMHEVSTNKLRPSTSALAHAVYARVCLIITRYS